MAGGFAVAVKLVDLVTGPLAGINKALGGLEKTTKKIGRESGFGEARDALKKIREQANDVGETLGKAFRPLEGLGAAASLGGLALLTQRFAASGGEIARTSAALGLNTADLQNWRAAADLAGIGAEAMTGSLARTANGIYLMRNGLNPDLFRVMQRWNLTVKQGGSDAEKAADLIGQVADAFQRPEFKGNQQAQRTLLQQLGIDERMLPVLQKGRDALTDYFEEAKRHGYLSEHQIGQAEGLERAYKGLEQSVGSLTMALAAQASTSLTPALKSWSAWLDKLRESPGAMKTVETGVDALGLLMGVTLVAQLGKLAVAANAVWAVPLWSFLVANPLVAAAIAAAAVMKPGTANAGENEAIKAHPELYPRINRHGAGFRIKGKRPAVAAEPAASRADNRGLIDKGLDWLGIRTPPGQAAPPAKPPPAAAHPAAYTPTGAPGLGTERHVGPRAFPLPERVGADKKAHAIAYFESRGWSHEQASGIVANLLTESSLRSDVYGDRGAAYGVGQWHPDRRQNFAQLFGHPMEKGTHEEQLAFADWELNHSEKASGDRLRRARSGAESGGIVSRYYERPADVAGNVAQRGRLATRLATEYPAMAAAAPTAAIGGRCRPGGAARYQPQARGQFYQCAGRHALRPDACRRAGRDDGAHALRDGRRDLTPDFAVPSATSTTPR